MSAKTPTSLYTVKRTEFLVITRDNELLNVAKDVAVFFSFSADFVASPSDIEIDSQNTASPMLAILSLLGPESVDDKIQMIKKLREIHPRSQILAAVQGGETLADRELFKAAGVHRFILHQELKSSSKLYYLCSLLVHGTYLPIAVTDLFPSTQVDFNAYHKLPINQKYLPVIFSGFQFSDKKYRRLEAVQQIYVRREDLGQYRKYIETYHDRTGAALKKRCRAVMMNIMGLHSEITLLLTLDSEASNGERLRAMIADFVQMASELGEYLKDCPDVWNVIARSLEFQFCRHERGPYILAYAVHIAMQTKMNSLHDIVMAVLLADIGILDLSAEAYKNLVKKGESHLPHQDIETYRNHPMSSLNRAMMREIEMSVELRSILVCTHERADETGFPNQVPKDKLPLEAQLVQFCEILDRRVRASLEDGIVTHDFVRKQVWEEEKDSLKRFNADFLDKIEKVLIA